jgi:hypothetical protein
MKTKNSFLIVPQWLAVRPEISPGAKLCYTRLTELAEGGYCSPDLEKLADSIGSDLQVVHDSLDELIKVVLVDREVYSGGKTYYFLLPHPWRDPEGCQPGYENFVNSILRCNNER